MWLIRSCFEKMLVAPILILALTKYCFAWWFTRTAERTFERHAHTVVSEFWRFAPTLKDNSLAADMYSGLRGFTHLLAQEIDKPAGQVDIFNPRFGYWKWTSKITPANFKSSSQTLDLLRVGSRVISGTFSQNSLVYAPRWVRCGTWRSANMKCCFRPIVLGDRSSLDVDSLRSRLHVVAGCVPKKRGKSAFTQRLSDLMPFASAETPDLISLSSFDLDLPYGFNSNLFISFQGNVAGNDPGLSQSLPGPVLRMGNLGTDLLPYKATLNGGSAYTLSLMVPSSAINVDHLVSVGDARSTLESAKEFSVFELRLHHNSDTRRVMISDLTLNEKVEIGSNGCPQNFFKEGKHCYDTDLSTENTVELRLMDFFDATGGDVKPVLAYHTSWQFVSQSGAPVEGLPVEVTIYDDCESRDQRIEYTVFTDRTGMHKLPHVGSISKTFFTNIEGRIELVIPVDSDMVAPLVLYRHALMETNKWKLIEPDAPTFAAMENCHGGEIFKRPLPDGEASFDEYTGPLFEGEDANEDAKTVCQTMEGLGLNVLRQRTSRRLAGFIVRELDSQDVSESELFSQASFDYDTGLYKSPELQMNWEERLETCSRSEEDEGEEEINQVSEIEPEQAEQQTEVQEKRRGRFHKFRMFIKKVVEKAREVFRRKDHVPTWSLSKLLSGAKELGIMVVKGTLYLIRKIGDEFVGAVMNTMRLIRKFFKHMATVFGKPVVKVLHWLKSTFRWSDILRTNAAFLSTTELALVSMRSLITEAHTRTLDGMDRALSVVKDSFEKIESKLESEMSAMPTNAQDNESSVEFTSNAKGNLKQSRVFTDMLAQSNHKADLPGSELVEIMAKHEGEFQRALGNPEEGKQLFELSKVKAPKSFLKNPSLQFRQVLLAFVRGLKKVVGFLFKAAIKIAKVVFKLIESIMDAVHALLFKEIRIPYVSSFVKKYLGIESLNLATIIGLTISIPYTVTYKILHGGRPPVSASTLDDLEVMKTTGLIPKFFKLLFKKKHNGPTLVKREMPRDTVNEEIDQRIQANTKKMEVLSAHTANSVTGSVSAVLIDGDEASTEFLTHMQAVFDELSNPDVLYKFVELAHSQTLNLQENMPWFIGLLYGSRITTLQTQLKELKDKPIMPETAANFAGVSKSFGGMSLAMSIMSLTLASVLSVLQVVFTALKQRISWLYARLAWVGARLIESLGTAIVNYVTRPHFKKVQLFDANNKLTLGAAPNPARETGLMVVKIVGVSLTAIAECAILFENFRIVQSLETVREIDEEKGVRVDRVKKHYLLMFVFDSVAAVLRLWGIPKAVMRFLKKSTLPPAAEKASNVISLDPFTAADWAFKAIRGGLWVTQFIFLIRGSPSITKEAVYLDYNVRALEQQKDAMLREGSAAQELGERLFEGLEALSDSSETGSSHSALSSDQSEERTLITYEIPPDASLKDIAVLVDRVKRRVKVRTKVGMDAVRYTKHIDHEVAYYSASVSDSIITINAWKSEQHEDDDDGEPFPIKYIN